MYNSCTFLRGWWFIVLNDKALHMKLDTQLYNSLKQAADEMHISLASVVRLACSEWLKRDNQSIKKASLDRIFDALPNYTGD